MARDVTRTLLLIDAEPAQVRLVGAIATRAGWRTVTAGDVEAALSLLARKGGRIDAMLLDSTAPGGAKPEIVSALRDAAPVLPILLLAASSAVSGVVEAMRAGATDYLVKPIAGDRLVAALDAATDRRASSGELRPLTEKISRSLAFDEIVGSTPDFRSALAIAAKAARARVPLLIEGESGVGKEVIARAIHAASPRARKPLVVVDCAAIAANLIESELFGHEKGAFTGAFDRYVGKVQDADGGTLLLDEVGALPADAQVKLLRLLESGEYQALGSRATRQVDVRVIVATNHGLLEEVTAGRFREDLYYRIAVVQVAIPPLRRRLADVPALARHLLARIAQQPGMRSLGITDEALHVLMAYGWPGNVRQLQTALFRAAILCEGDALTAVDFPHIARQSPGTAERGRETMATGAGITLFEPNGHMRSLEAIEADVIRLAIGHYRGRMTEVARRLGIGRSTLYRKLGELGIDNAA
ncbi:sigma-54-dependent transcriptional regulator [Sphingomonas solaris]|uniref:DNA-binding transcriptional regulator NtrC n=1 Tax=Alterirhizorhabdus solaris TaxID=2529389 RepID=A0A558R389_9SPHN|nr:sigma-54 dependent transcriptional regulator [Sphingomonas solaris]TVV73844.1 sigma-54-dependent Fis family transcriptional regulator [Sphingomonas solaris]